MKKLLLILMMVSFAGVNTANAVIIGAGTESCKEFTDSSKSSKTIEIAFLFWMQGFISGLNVTNNTDKGTNNNSDDIFSDVKILCSASPSKLFVEAVTFIYSYES